MAGQKAQSAVFAPNVPAIHDFVLFNTPEAGRELK